MAWYYSLHEKISDLVVAAASIAKQNRNIAHDNAYMRAVLEQAAMGKMVNMPRVPLPELAVPVEDRLMALVEASLTDAPGKHTLESADSFRFGEASAPSHDDHGDQDLVHVPGVGLLPRSSLMSAADIINLEFEVPVHTLWPLIRAMKHGDTEAYKALHQAAVGMSRSSSSHDDKSSCKTGGSKATNHSPADAESWHSRVRGALVAKSLRAARAQGRVDKDAESSGLLSNLPLAVFQSISQNGNSMSSADIAKLRSSVEPELKRPVFPVSASTSDAMLPKPWLDQSARRLNASAQKHISTSHAERKVQQPQMPTASPHHYSAQSLGQLQRLLPSPEFVTPTGAVVQMAGDDICDHTMQSGRGSALPAGQLMSRGDSEEQRSESVPQGHGTAIMRGHEPIPDDVRTLIVRNIPARCSQDQLLDFWPPHGSYNLLHLPYSYTLRRNVGYAFVNFISKEALFEFREEWRGKMLMPSAGAKRLDIGIAEVQGLVANLRHMKRSKKNYRVRNRQHMPIILKPDGSLANFREVMGSLDNDEDLEEADHEGDS
jgi:hypothetical protein